MKKLVFVLVAMFCINNLAWSQEEKEEKVEKTQELRYFKEDDAFYSGSSLRLLDSEVRQTLSKNVSAFEMFERGNAFKKANKDLQIAIWVLLGVEGLVCVLPLITLTNDEYFKPLMNTFIYASVALLCAAVGLEIALYITKAKYKSCYSEAVGIYNKGLYKPSASLHIGTTGNGIGFSLKF